MSDDELYYLQPDFDLNSLTVAKLRGVLLAHDINYPASAKKGELVDIVQSELLPRAKKLLRDRDRVRRTSRGITDVPSSQEGTLDGSDDRERMPPPPAPKTPRSRKSKTTLNQEGVQPTPKSARRSRTPSTKRTTKTPRISDTETTETEHDGEPQSSRQARKSAPGGRLSDVVDKRRSLDNDDSPFTQDNPFQQSSSPPSDSKRTISGSGSRKSFGASTTRKSTSSRRTRSPTTVKREEYEIPVSHLSRSADGVETTEEFTHEAKTELSRDMAADRRIAKARSKDVNQHQKKVRSPAAQAAPWTVLLVALGVAAGFYRQEKVAIGYCGVGQPRWSLAEVENVPSWVHESLEPQCEPCPQHATCHANMQVECDHDFVLHQHPLSLNGLVPIPPTCEPDSEKEKRIKTVADRAIEELRQRRAAYECGDELAMSASTANQEPSATVVSPVKLEISEDALKQTIAKQRRKNMSPEEFDHLWDSALGDIKRRDEIEITQDKLGHTLLSSTSFANLPFACALRRSALRALAANRIPLLILAVLAGTIAYAQRRFRSYRAAQAQTPSLVSMTLDRLATQAALKEDGRVQDAFLSVSQLRDLVLSHVFERKERERVWERVKQIVEANSNVRAATREGGKSGEWSRSWEWIGPVNFAPGIEGRRSGGYIESSPIVSNDASPAMQERKGTELRTWDEGRPIY